MHVVSTNFAKTLVYKREYDVILWCHKQRISSNKTTIRSCLILEFRRGASNQAVAPGITRPLHATAWALSSLSLLSIRVDSLVTKGRIQGAIPEICESNFINHNFLQSGKQHSRYKAILPSTVLSLQCCEVYFTSLIVSKPLWDLTSKYYWNSLL